MNDDYVSDVRRFGGLNPFVDASGQKQNLSHKDNIDPKAVITNGIGDIESIPLLRKKPCFGRPERHLRGLFGGKPWTDEVGERRPGTTNCYTCEKRSPDTFLGCCDVVAERIASNPHIEKSFNDWIDGTGNRLGPACFVNSHGRRWTTLLKSIEAHGGWSNVNDDQVKANAVAAAEKEKKRRRDAEKARRDEGRKRRQGLIRPISVEFLKALDAERDRRATHLKSLRNLRGERPQDTLWLRIPSDATWDRVADVWREREHLRYSTGHWTGKAIAEILIAKPQYKLKKLSTMQARVSDDLKRIKKLENDGADESLWAAWTFAP